MWPPGLRPGSRLPPSPSGSRLGLSDLDLSGILGEHKHDGEASQEAQVLDDKGDQGAALPFVLLADLIHLREHISQRNIQEHSSSQCKDPGGREVAASQDAKGQTHITAAGREEVEEESLLDTHPSVEQDDKVPELVWELLAEDGHRGADALEDGHGEGGTDGQAVNEVVQAVAQGDHPGQGADVRVADTLQPVTGALGGLQVLDRERAHDDLLFRHGGLPIQPTAAVLRNHVVQIPVLQLLCHPLLLVLLGGECLRGIMAMSVMPLVFLLKKYLQDLLCEKEKIKAPKHQCRLSDIRIFQRVETKSLWTQENKMSLRK